MPLYEYKCPSHGKFILTTRNDSQPCPECGRDSTRRFSFAIQPSFKEGYTPTTGSFVRNRADFISQLNRKYDELSERNGIPHKLVPVDLRDKEACGITEEAVYNIEKTQSDKQQGLIVK